MTIAFPRTIPSTRISKVMFEPEPQEANSGELGGRFTSAMLGPTLWQAEIATTPPNEREFSLWRSWLDTLDGAGKEIYLYDVRRPLPWKYRRTGFAGLVRAQSLGAFDGTSAKWTVNGARDEITVGAQSGAELPAGFEIGVGDYIGLQWTGADSGKQRRSVHRVADDYNADGNGVGIWTVRPSIHPDVPANAVVNFVKPSCIMKVTKRDRDAEHKSRRVAFEAAQNLEFD